MLKYLYAYEDAFGNEIEVFECEDCGRQHSVYTGGDVALCICEVP